VAGDLNGPTKPNATSLINNPTGTESASDIGGYDKLNQYRVYGDIVRLNKDWGWGVLKMGGVYEWSGTHRFNLLEDFTEGGPAFLGGYPDDKFTLKKYPLLPATTNAKTQEKSAYQNWQVFADFELHPIQNLTLTPGVKYVHSNIQVNAADENVASASGATEYKNEPLTASNAYSSPVYFFTANYRIRPDLAAYGQVATSFLLPGLPDLYYQAASTQQLQPEKTTTYQGGLVYSHGNITADADVYRVDASNLQINCTIYTPTPEAATCNAGLARYTGVEGEAAYAFDFGLTLFANGSLMSAKQLANAANAAAGIAGNPAEELTNSPGWTDAIGGLYRSGRWQGSLTYKQSGAYVATYNGGIGNRLPGYDTFDGSVSYDFGHVLLKLQAFNLLDRRAITSFNGSVLYSRTDPGLYEFQAGRNLEATLIAKF
jgi:iron complex outermembrane receptor protein